MEKITRFERTRIIGARALQISFGAPSLIKPKKDMTPIEIAAEEIEKKVIPLVVLRTYPNGEIKKINLA
jgi:DNA-directed RNA polymerase subunit K/omega